jgi:hypothetical protein
MPWLSSILAEIWGLFVDDGTFALAILVWLAVYWVVLPHFGVPPELKGPILFAGLATVLVESALRRARS